MERRHLSDCWRVGMQMQPPSKGVAFNARFPFIDFYLFLFFLLPYPPLLAVECLQSITERN